MTCGKTKAKAANKKPAKKKPAVKKAPKSVAPPAGHARDPELEAAIASGPEDREAHRVYADWLQTQHDPWGEVIALGLAALDEEGTARKLKINARMALDRYIEGFWIPKFPLLEHRFRAWNKTTKFKSPDNIANWSSCQILFRWGVIRELGLRDWRGQMFQQGLELLQHPDVRFVEKLGLPSTPIEDLSVLAQMQSLWQLDLFKMPVREFEPLVALRKLEYLALDHTRVERIDALARVPLISLYLQNTAVTDLRPLAKLNSLELINLVNTKVTDIEPLFELPRLREVWLDGSTVPKAAAEKLQALFRGRTYDEPRSRVGHSETPIVYGP